MWDLFDDTDLIELDLIMNMHTTRRKLISALVLSHLPRNPYPKKWAIVNETYLQECE